MKSAKEITIDYLENIVKEKQNLLDTHDFPEINIHKMNIVRLKKL